MKSWCSDVEKNSCKYVGLTLKRADNAKRECWFFGSSDFVVIIKKFLRENFTQLQSWNETIRSATVRENFRLHTYTYLNSEEKKKRESERADISDNYQRRRNQRQPSTKKELLRAEETTTKKSYDVEKHSWRDGTVFYKRGVNEGESAFSNEEDQILLDSGCFVGIESKTQCANKASSKKQQPSIY